MTTDPTPLALMLTDEFRLDTVAVMSESTTRPPLWSVNFRSAGSLRTIIATERQLTQLRDELDLAIGRARDISQHTPDLRIIR